MALVPPAAELAPAKATGAEALILLAAAGTGGAAGGALPARYQMSTLALPVVMPSVAAIDHPVMVAFHGNWMLPFRPVAGTVPPPSMVMPIEPWFALDTAAIP